VRSLTLIAVVVVGLLAACSDAPHVRQLVAQCELKAMKRYGREPGQKTLDLVNEYDRLCMAAKGYEFGKPPCDASDPYAPSFPDCYNRK
jgi:hypothetical protein